MKAKLVKEALKEHKVSLETATWSDVDPSKSIEWAPKYVNLPMSFMSSRSIFNDRQFIAWKGKFIDEWGTAGDLVKYSQTSWKLVGNKNWDEECETGKDSVRKFYSNKKSGDYIGD